MSGITIRGDQQLLQTFADINDFDAWATPPMRRAVEIVKDEAQIQPKKAPGAFSALATPGQRRAYWAKVSSGEITHSDSSGYVRSGKLKRGWETNVTGNRTGVIGFVFNTVNYGGWVQSVENQQPFHFVSGWGDTDDIIENTEKDIMNEFSKATAERLR